MTSGDEAWSGCCLHHSRAKGVGCHVHAHLFRIASHGWLRRTKRRAPSLLVAGERVRRLCCPKLGTKEK